METKTKVGHTSTPWQVHEGTTEILGPRCEFWVADCWYGESGKEDNVQLRKANAEFIVRAVNAHEYLIEACKLAVTHCPCTIKERLSGHRTDCYSPIYEAAIAKAAGAQK